MTEIRDTGRPASRPGAPDLCRAPEEHYRQCVQGTHRPTHALRIRLSTFGPTTHFWLLCPGQEYQRTGYVWEQYDALTGEGKRRFVLRDLFLGASAEPAQLTTTFSPLKQPSIYGLDLARDFE